MNLSQNVAFSITSDGYMSKILPKSSLLLGIHVQQVRWRSEVMNNLPKNRH